MDSKFAFKAESQTPACGNCNMLYPAARAFAFSAQVVTALNLG